MKKWEECPRRRWSPSVTADWLQWNLGADIERPTIGKIAALRNRASMRPQSADEISKDLLMRELVSSSRSAALEAELERTPSASPNQFSQHFKEEKFLSGSNAGQTRFSTSDLNTDPDAWDQYRGSTNLYYGILNPRVHVAADTAWCSVVNQIRFWYWNRLTKSLNDRRSVKALETPSAARDLKWPDLSPSSESGGSPGNLYSFQILRWTSRHLTVLFSWLGSRIPDETKWSILHRAIEERGWRLRGRWAWPRQVSRGITQREQVQRCIKGTVAALSAIFTSRCFRTGTPAVWAGEDESTATLDEG